MKIRGLYSPNAVTAKLEESLSQAAVRMTFNNISALPVLDNGMLVGMITERDITRAAANGRHPTTCRVASYMSRQPAVVRPDEESTEVAGRMIELGVRHLPVVEGDRLVGIISARDLLLLEAWPPLLH
jgi:CBS domain-containing protein